MLPPPAPTVCTSTIGSASARPPTSRPPVEATRPSRATDTSHEVPPMSRPTAPSAPAASASQRRAHGAARRAREHGPRAVPRGGGGVGHAAAAQHDLRRRQAGARGALGEPLEVAAQQRRERGVDDGRGAALVLAEHAGGLVRGGHVHVAVHLGGELGDAPLVLLVAEAPQQADRHRLDVVAELGERAAQGVLVELAQHAVGPAALVARRLRSSRRHERRRVRRRTAGRARAAPGGRAPRGR